MAPLKPISASSVESLNSPTSYQPRRGSVASTSTGSQAQADKYHLAQTLDKIHTSASQSDALTTFNDFADPPASAPPTENKTMAGELMQQGLSGLYSRFKEAVGVASHSKTLPDYREEEIPAFGAKRSPNSGHSASKSSVSSIHRTDTVLTVLSVQSNPSSEAVSAIVSPIGPAPATPDSQNFAQSFKGTGIGSIKSHSSSRQSLPSTVSRPSGVIAEPTTSAVTAAAHRVGSRVSLRADTSSGRSSSRKSLGKGDHHPLLSPSETTGIFDSRDLKTSASSRSRKESMMSLDGSVGSTPASPIKSPVPSTQSSHARNTSGGSAGFASKVLRAGPSKREESRPRSPVYSASHSSSLDVSTGSGPPPGVRAAALKLPFGSMAAAEQVNAKLDRMRRQVSSKEFWMKDETCRECFLCATPFTAWRRKHHCRTCGCIFDSRCTSMIPGSGWGVSGQIRVCKTCLDVINRRSGFEPSGSDDDSADESYLPTTIYRGNQPKSISVRTASPARAESSEADNAQDTEDARSVTTPMMAIPTRRVGDSGKRSSAVLEIDMPHLSRPSSSRSLKSLTAGRPQSSGHKRHRSRHDLLGRFKPASDHRAPFRRGIDEELLRKQKLPAFHDDNIIDPDLAQFMSDESSADEQMSIVAAMSRNDLNSSSFDNDKAVFGPYLGAGKRHKGHRQGEKSVSGLSFTTRGTFDDIGPINAMTSHQRPTRRRNLSTVGGNMHHHRSPRPKSGIFIKGPSISNETLAFMEARAMEATVFTRSDSLRHHLGSSIEMGPASMEHATKLLRQLLEDADVPNVPAWEKALMPILLKCTDDVEPNIRDNDFMDVRKYIKLKKIPGARPGDTCYVSGIIFTKNLALKSMPRKILNPQVVVISFPLEYQRHHPGHFMSLQPVIEQEKEFLRIVVSRLLSLNPQVLLAEKGISGVALQYLAEANVAVVANVNPRVIDAVVRCTGTQVISSVDMLSIKELKAGRCEGFEVKTYVNREVKGRKKSYIFLSGCPKDRGCTVALRGAPTAVLSQMKIITEFMTYVIYNMKLESSLLRDFNVCLPDTTETLTAPTCQLPAVRTGSVSSSLSLGSTPENAPTVAHSSIQTERDSSTRTSVSHFSISSMSGTGDEELKAASTDDSPTSTPTLIQAGPRLGAVHESQASHASAEPQVPDDIPMPTFYSNMIAKYETKILSASPFVKFTQPYLLMKAREQERRLSCLKRLRDQDGSISRTELDKAKPPKFQLINPAMVNVVDQKAPPQLMDVLHAVHDAEYDKALHNYQTQTRNWENYIQGNLDLFDPYSHQNIVVLHSLTCTETKIPCVEPTLIAISFYDEQDEEEEMEPDMCLGNFIEAQCYDKDSICEVGGCDRRMTEHHRTYVHDQARVTVFIEHAPDKSIIEGSVSPKSDKITIWSYCKECKKDMPARPMGPSAWKYSLGKYLELLFWSKGLRLNEDAECPHDHTRDHIQYFQFRDGRVRIHYDPIDLLEIVGPRARITWKVEKDLNLKNDLFTSMRDRWCRFIASVQNRLKSITIDSVLPDKATDCKAELERMAKKTHNDQALMVRRLQDTYINSKYYEVIPFNIVMRDMLMKATEWDNAFNKFEADFLGDKDLKQLTIIQLRKIFSDDEAKETPVETTAPPSVVDGEEKLSQMIGEEDEKAATQPSDEGVEAILPPKLDDSQETPTQENFGMVESHEFVAENLESQGSMAGGGENRSSGANRPAALVLDRSDIVAMDSFYDPKSPAYRGQHQQLAPHRGTETDPDDSISPKSYAPPTFSPHSLPEDLGEQPTGERIGNLRRDLRMQASSSSEHSESSVPPSRPVPDRTSSRRPHMPTSPPPRAMSRGLGIPRASSAVGRITGPRERTSQSQSQSQNRDQSQDTNSDTNVSTRSNDRRLSERLVGALKGHRKQGPSAIPRPVKKRDSKVSTLAKHFEQLSREFQKEAIKDRNKKRAATLRQPRAVLPRTSTTKAIVEVYDDVNEAVQEPGPMDLEASGGGERDAGVKPVESEPTATSATTTEPAPEIPNIPATPETSEMRAIVDVNVDDTPGDALAQTNKDTSVKIVQGDETSAINMSQAASDDEGVASDAEHSILDDLLPDVKEIADSLQPHTEIPQELPKHQKVTLMRMLTNFWSERSASSWPQLDYPVNPSDHIFLDSEIIVREDEPSSLIAFALSSEDYRAKLRSIRSKKTVQDDRGSDKVGGDAAEMRSETPRPESSRSSLAIDPGFDEKKSLLRSTGTHLKYDFREGTATMLCKILYAEQFDALRRKCGVADRFIESLSRCVKWDSKGGKTKSTFLKTLDDRWVLKSLSPVETAAFLKFAPSYFGLMAEVLFHDLPSVIAKMLGFFQVHIKNPATNTEMKLDLLVMENLFYDRCPSRIFDLKGSMRNRKIQSTGEQNEVLLDENMVEYIYESPLFAREHSKRLLKASVWNDTLFLARQNVMDYSLMVAVDAARKELVVGIIDCIRTYTWDKKLESWIKDRGFAGGGRNRPTVTSPKEYKSRFREAMARYILQAPNPWHQFGGIRLQSMLRLQFEVDGAAD